MLQSTLYDLLPACLANVILEYACIHIVRVKKEVQWLHENPPLCILDGILYYEIVKSVWTAALEHRTFRNPKRFHGGWLNVTDRKPDNFQDSCKCYTLTTPELKLKLVGTRDPMRNLNEAVTVTVTKLRSKETFKIKHKRLRNYICDGTSVYSCREFYPKCIQRHVHSKQTIDFPLPSTLKPSSFARCEWTWTVFKNNILIVEKGKVYVLREGNSTWDEIMLDDSYVHDHGTIISDCNRCYIASNQGLYRLDFLSINMSFYRLELKDADSNTNIAVLLN